MIKKLICTMALCMPLIIQAQPSTINSAEQCQTLSCIRSHIDNINTQLVELIAKRLSYVQRAGELKAKTIAIHDQAREDEILKNVGLQIEKLGYPASIAQTIFKTILAQSNQYEEKSREKTLSR